MSNKTYDVLKKIALVVMPALVTLFGTVAKIWDIPYGVEISLTLAAVETFLGAVLANSSAKYAKQQGEDNA